MKAHFCKTTIYLVLLAFCLLTLQPGCISTSDLKIVSSQLTSREFTGDLNIRNSMSVVTGVARNTKAASINNCEITVTFYDAQHNNIGVATTSRELLGAGETWNFTAQLTSADAWKARSFDISASNQ
jgi:hypothetical protein